MNVRDIERQVGGHRARRVDEQVAPRRAAVALILREAREDDPPELLFIRRGRREGDPWSGQMAFPGGHREPDDRDEVATAIRETREEIGLDLQAQARLIGQLDDLQSVAHGRVLPMAISPVVFSLRGEPPALRLDAAEVDEAIWLPLGALADHQYDGTIEVDRFGHSLSLPCWRVGPHCIWGLTYIMTHSLLQLLGRSEGALRYHPAFRDRA